MTLRIHGLPAARRMRDLMAALSGGMVEMRRAADRRRAYWVHCPTLDATSEQIILDRIPRGTLLKVEAATYKKQNFDCFTPSEALLTNVRSFVEVSRSR